MESQPHVLILIKRITKKILSLKLEYCVRSYEWHVRISKYKNIFPKGYVPYWSEEVFYD